MTKTALALLLFVAAAALVVAAPGARAADTPPDPVAGAPVVTLAEALRAARVHQPALDLARGNSVTARGLADQARGALLPQLNGSVSYTRATTNFVPQPGGTTPSGMQAQVSSFSTVPLWVARLSGSQLVYDFGESINRWKSARAAADAVDASFYTTAAQVDYNARSAFFTARAAKDLVGVARDNLANQEKHLAQVQGFVEVGTHPAIDLSQAKADRATAQLQLITAENSYAVAKAMLNQAMGVERSVDYDLADEEMPPVVGEDGNVEVLVDDAKQKRPEMANLRFNLKSQQLGLLSARDMYWPALSLSGSANDSGPYVDRTSWNYSGMVSLSVPLLQGGAIDAQIHQAQGQLVQAQAQLETERQQVRLDVEQARLGIRAAKAAIESAEDALVNTRDRLRLAEGRYTTGVGSIIELGDAQVALTTAAANKVSAQYQLYTARAQLVKALGKAD
ncbi:MAG TPA: TolC family protein [Polyangia bacterium]|nr:TolC family protein [Polyangia bacterium]